MKAAVLAGPALVLQTAAVRAGAAAPQLPSSHSPTHFSGKREPKVREAMGIYMWG